MIKTLRQLAIAGLLLPVCLPLAAATSGISNKVQQSLKANKISSQSLSVVTLPLTVLVIMWLAVSKQTLW